MENINGLKDMNIIMRMKLIINRISKLSLTLSTGMHMIQILGEALILFVGLFLYQ